MPVQRLDPSIELGQALGADRFEGGIQWVTTHHLKVLAVETLMLDQPSTQGLQLVDVLCRDYRVYVNSDVRVSVPHRVERLDGPDRLVEVPRHAPDPIVSLGKAIQRQIQVDLELGKRCRDELHEPDQPVTKQTVRRQVKRADLIALIKELDDVGQPRAHHRLTTGQPQFPEPGHRPGQGIDLVKTEVTRPVQLLPVKTGATLGVAPTGDEEDQGPELHASACGTVRPSIRLLPMLCRTTRSE